MGTISAGLLHLGCRALRDGVPRILNHGGWGSRNREKSWDQPKRWAYLAGGMGIPAPGHQDQQLGFVLFHKLLTLRKDRQTMCRSQSVAELLCPVVLAFFTSPGHSVPFDWACVCQCLADLSDST